MCLKIHRGGLRHLLLCAGFRELYDEVIAREYLCAAVKMEL
jgi:hypothetical protein